MATSGSFETTARISGSYNTKAKFSWWQTGQSVSGNYTDISWKLEGVTASQYQYIYVYGVSVTVNGGTTSKSFNGKMYNGTELASGSARIYHNNDGTKSFSASASIEQYSTGSWYSGSNSWTLNTIARASQPSINTYPNNSPDFNVGDTITIHMNQAADSFTHTVKMNYGSSSYTIATGVKYNCTFNTSTLANELYALMPSSTNYGSTISVTTYNGSTNIGTKTCAYNAKAVEANVKPQFSDFEYADTNSAVTAITGNNQYLVQGKSTLAVTVSRANRALPVMFTSMASYISSLSGKTVSATYDSESDVVMTFADNAFTPGTQTLAVKATDARGYSTSVNKNVNVIAYSSPTIAATATRAGNFENETTLHIEGTFAPVTIEGTAKNTVTNVKYRYKKQSTSTWGSWINMSGLTPTSAGAYTTTNVVLNLANTDAWDIQVQTTDRFETSTASLTVSVGVPVFRIGTDGYVYNNEQRILTVEDLPEEPIDTGWVDLTQYIENTYHYAPRSDQPPKVRRIGNVVYFAGEIYCKISVGVMSSTLLINIPAQFAPELAQITGGGTQYEVTGSSYMIYAEKNQNGTCQIRISQPDKKIVQTNGWQGYALSNIPPYLAAPLD